MFGHQCFKCGAFWASMANPDLDYAIITKLCPDCIVKRLPVMDRHGLIQHPAVAARAKHNM